MNAAFGIEGRFVTGGKDNSGSSDRRTDCARSNYAHADRARRLIASAGNHRRAGA
jgi:hypothetical protein